MYFKASSPLDHFSPDWYKIYCKVVAQKSKVVRGKFLK
jgi:hypothetical protein